MNHQFPFKMAGDQPSKHLLEKLQKDQRLLESIQAHLPELESLLYVFQSDYEDRMYRLYYQSFKVYSLQDSTETASRLFEKIGGAVEGELSDWFHEILSSGVGCEFELEHNKRWLFHTRPIVEAFLHAKYFLEMMVRYAKELDTAPSVLPTGWAAILCLYNQR